MTITSQTYTPLGNIIQVDVVSDLTDPSFYWYLDGIYTGSTVEPRKSFYVSAGEQAEIVVLDSVDPAFDPIASAPTAFPARRSLQWVRSVDADVEFYRVKQQREAEGFLTIAEVPAVAGRWLYSLLSPRLDDLTNYTWEVVPVDAAGNEGTAQTIGPELVVRKPDAPDFTATFNPGPDTVTFAAG